MYNTIAIACVLLLKELFAIVNIMRGGICMKKIEWMCTACGRKVLYSESIGRPKPGICPKKSRGSHHTWVKNRTIGK